MLWAALTIGIFFTFATSDAQQGRLPRDEDGNIICAPHDPYCAKFRQMMRGSGKSDYSRMSNFNQLSAFRKGGEGGKDFQCTNAVTQKICEAMKKTCYTNGKCGDLVQEESKQVVFDE